MSQTTNWSGFHKKTPKERIEILSAHFPNLNFSAFQPQSPSALTLASADRMTENCVGSAALPLGICPYFVINGVSHVVPMATEEPSVVAACCAATKLIAENGGFAASSSANVMTGQVALYCDDAADAGRWPKSAARAVAENRAVLIEKGNALCPSMVARGGGVVDVRAEVVGAGGVPPFVVVSVDIDVCDSMGANLTNTICEGLAGPLTALTNTRAGLRVLTNLCAKRTARASFRLPVARLGWKGVPGALVAARLLEAHAFARADVARAVTNNKGVMNGADAVAAAAGQDWRALEAAAHATAAAGGRYAPLAEYRLEEGGAVLAAELELPVAVGTAGGAVAKNPGARLALRVMGVSGARELAQVVVAAGLANNFAALRALAVEGIQKGHMRLHARGLGGEREEEKEEQEKEEEGDGDEEQEVVGKVGVFFGIPKKEAKKIFDSKLTQWDSFLGDNLGENPKGTEENLKPSFLFVSHRETKTIIPFLSTPRRSPAKCIEFSGDRSDIKFSYKKFAKICDFFIKPADKEWVSELKLIVLFADLLLKIFLVDQLDSHILLQLRNLFSNFCDQSSFRYVWLGDNGDIKTQKSLHIVISALKMFADTAKTRFAAERVDSLFREQKSFLLRSLDEFSKFDCNCFHEQPHLAILSDKNVCRKCYPALLMRSVDEFAAEIGK